MAKNMQNQNGGNKNIDLETVNSFGDEWLRFDQVKLPDDEALRIFSEYFAVFPFERLSANASGFDMGCGTGRWAKLMAPRVGHLHCIDPSSAIRVAQTVLQDVPNVTFHHSSLDECMLQKNSQDFGYSLGVLHHVPDTLAAIRVCVEFLKPGAPFQVYLYYSFDNRSVFFRLVWRFSDLLRRVICRMPSKMKAFVTDVLAVVVYLPLSRFALVLEAVGFSVSNLPLSYYRNHSFYTMRTDSRDRFGTPLEQRFSRVQIRAMLQSAGLSDIVFSEKAPYWCAVGIKQ